MSDVMIIPAYKPDDNLIKLVDALSDQGFHIIVVDDGSGREFKQIFSAIKKKATVVVQPENLGKGAAIKKGIEVMRYECKDSEYFLTADADGQHKVEDILRVRDALHEGNRLVLTVRDLKHNVPFRSKVGNDLSRFVFGMLTGTYLSDNQSGLRGFATEHAEWLLKVKGDKYDYELNALYCAKKQGIEIYTLPIETIYIDGNKSSHFQPVEDTVRIYRQLFCTAWVSLAMLLLAEIMVTILMFTMGYDFIFATLPTVGLFTSVLHVILNKTIAFKGMNYKDAKRSVGYHIARYVFYTSCVIILGVYHMPLLLAFNLSLIIGVIIESVFRAI